MSMSHSQFRRLVSLWLTDAACPTQALSISRGRRRKIVLKGHFWKGGYNSCPPLCQKQSGDGIIFPVRDIDSRRPLTYASVLYHK